VLLAIVVAAVAVIFLKTLRAVQRGAKLLPGPAWLRPAWGGLFLGIFATPVIYWVGQRVGTPGQGLGLLGGGYGAAQMAITGSTWLPEGWGAVQILLLFAAAKIVASALTIGSGGSAGDFAPSLVLGGVIGGAFGHAAHLLLPNQPIDPGAFALVGMGVFYGGLAHAPVSALILVSELAGSYDLLVPAMLANGVAFVALRKHALYAAQVPSRSQSPVHRRAMLPELVQKVRVADVMVKDRIFTSFRMETPAREIVMQLQRDESSWQDVFPVIDADERLRGVIPSDALRILSGPDLGWAIAADLMRPPVSVTVDEDLRRATSLMLREGLRELPVVDATGRVIGFIDEAETARAYLDATTTDEPPAA
jgi:CIC family chloride channel protein